MAVAFGIHDDGVTHTHRYTQAFRQDGEYREYKSREAVEI